MKNNKLILKSQQIYRSEKHDVFTKEVTKIAVSANDYKTMQSIHLIETYAYGMNKDLICKTEQTKCSNIIKQRKKKLWWCYKRKHKGT